MPRLLFRLCVLCLLWPAAAAAVPIAAFQGVWRGNAVSESAVSANFQLTSRDIDVTVRLDGDGGFDIAWNTVQRQSGSPDNPRAKLKSTKMRFVPARPGVWRGDGNRDPLAANAPYAWAYITDNTLRIVTMQIYPDGGHEMQIYKRTLSGTGMVLEFTRNVNGARVRQATGRLIKVAK